MPAVRRGRQVIPCGNLFEPSGNKGGSRIAVSLRSDSADSGEIPLPTAVGIGMTCRGSGNAGSVKARSGFVVYCAASYQILGSPCAPSSSSRITDCEVQQRRSRSGVSTNVHRTRNGPDGVGIQPV